MSTSVSISTGAVGERSVKPKPQVRGSEKSQLSIFRVFFLLLVVCLLALLSFLVWEGGTYYASPLQERYTHPLHQTLKPSGALGHSLGIIGTLMMLSIFVYSLRKKWKFLQRFGSQNQWLQMHIFMGFAGPVLVTFHTTGKLGGIVSVAFYSMWAMVFSGVIGRYLYAKIPRTVQGNKMGLREIEDRLAELVDKLHHDQRKGAILEGIETLLARTRRQRGGLLRALFRSLRDDLSLPLDAIRIWRIVGIDQGLSLRKRLRVMRLVLKQQRILNHLAVLDAMQQLFSYWHVFHKPFTVLTFVIVSLHVSVALYLGYGLAW